MKLTYGEMAHRTRSERSLIYDRKAELPGPELVTSSLSARVLHSETPLTRDMIQNGHDLGRRRHRPILMALRCRGRGRGGTYRHCSAGGF